MRDSSSFGVSFTSFHQEDQNVFRGWEFAEADPSGSAPGTSWGARGSGPRSFLVLVLVQEQHPEEELIKTKQDEVNAAWQRLKGLALQRQGKLFGAAEVQRFNRYHSRGASGTRPLLEGVRYMACAMRGRSDWVLAQCLFPVPHRPA